MGAQYTLTEVDAAPDPTPTPTPVDHCVTNNGEIKVVDGKYVIGGKCPAGNQATGLLSQNEVILSAL